MKDYRNIEFILIFTANKLVWYFEIFDNIYDNFKLSKHSSNTNSIKPYMYTLLTKEMGFEF